MYDAGCRWLFFGIESGSEERLKAIKKGIAYNKIVETIANCYNAGIVPITGFIIGFPDETEEELRGTIALAQKLPFAMHVINIFTALPGSESYQQLKDEGRLALSLSLQDIAKFSPFEQVVQNFSKVSTKELEVIRSFFEMSNFMRRKPSNQTKSFVLASKVLKERFRDMNRDGPLIFLKNLAGTIAYALKMVAYAYLSPRIRKKYGLYTKATKVVFKRR